MKEMAKHEVNEVNEQSPFCFIKAFVNIHNIAVERNITTTKDVFTIFKGENP